MAQDLLKYNIPSIEFNPTAFQGIEFKPQLADMNLLARSIDKIEQRQRDARDKYNAMNVAFGEMKAKLHQDADTLKWFETKENQARNELQTYLNMGLYGDAITQAGAKGAEFVDDAEYIDRVKSNEQYKKWTESLDNMKTRKEISNSTYNWAMKTNPYEYKATYDDNGNFVSGTSVDMGTLPLEDVKYEEKLKQAFELIHPDIKGREHSSSRHVDGTGSSSSSSSQFSQVTEKDIQTAITTMFNQDNHFLNQVIQDYKVQTNELKDTSDRIEELEKANQTDNVEYQSLLYKKERLESSLLTNGQAINYGDTTQLSKFAANRISETPLAKLMAYKKDVRGSSSSSQVVNKDTPTTTNRRYDSFGNLIEETTVTNGSSNPGMKAASQRGSADDNLPPASLRVENKPSFYQELK